MIYEINNFIYMGFLDNQTVCDDLINFYKSNQDLVTEGRVSQDGVNKVIKKDIKESFDLNVPIKDAVNNPKFSTFNNFLSQLKTISENYIKHFPYCNEFSPWGITEDLNLQHYIPGAGFKKWHTERTSPAGVNASRHLVWMTYLNDVTDQGETDFYHQRIKIKPKKGLTIIWPADWTHTHRGIPSPTQEKYVITGWYNYIPPAN
jgi:hypothetical protein